MTSRMPTMYIPHGGGPWPFVSMGLPQREVDALAGYLRGLASVVKPEMILCVSAHWETPTPTVMTSAAPPILYDYYGFPPASYEITWPAPGSPKLAGRARELLAAAGITTESDGARGFDHGTFIPLKVTWPEAKIPTIQLSLKQGLDPSEHLAMGRALAPLRDEGVLIVGSGMSYHNMRGFGDPRARNHADAFDAWLGETVTADAATRDRKLARWTDAPSARMVHPREEHLLPLMVAAGAAGEDRGKIAYNDTFLGVRLSGVHFAA